MKLIFVTTNEVKFKTAAEVMEQFGVQLEQAELELDELQADGEAIARHKAAQAFEKLGKPVVVTDDSWDIPGLNGFPGPYMKPMNQWLSGEDFLRLTETLTDRRIILRQHTVYQDADGQQYFVSDIVGTLLREVRGHNKYPSLTITSFANDGRSRAEALAAGQALITPDMPSVWLQLAQWLKSR